MASIHVAAYRVNANANVSRARLALRAGHASAHTLSMSPAPAFDAHRPASARKIAEVKRPSFRRQLAWVIVAMPFASVIIPVVLP